MLAWNANSEENLAGYKLYYKTGTSGAPYDGKGLAAGDSPVIIDLADLADTTSPTFILTGLEDGTTYSLALTAFNEAGLEGNYSDEISYESAGGTSETPEATSHTITASTAGQGTISPEGTVNVTEGESQTFTIVADANYHIAGVTADGTSVGQVGIYTFENVTASHTISAVFEIDTFTITAMAGENGSISPRGVTNAVYGTSLSYAITPAEGYHISDVLVDGSSLGQVSTYTFENISTWHTIRAVFEIDEIVIVEDNTGGEEESAPEETTTNEPVDTGTSNAEADTNRAPETPVALVGMIEASGVGPVELSVGGFSDPDEGDYHSKTEWRVIRDDDEICILNLSSIFSSLTTFRVPEIMLDENSAYTWQARFFDNNNDASEWSEAAHFTTGFSDTDLNGNGLPDSQEVDDSVDLNEDGISDAKQEIIKSVVVPLSNQSIGLSIEESDTAMAILFMETVDIDSLPISEMNKGRTQNFPFGLINFKLAVAEVGDTATVTVHFSEAVDPLSKWVKLDVINGVWLEFSGYFQLSDDLMSMTLELVDGGFGDADGVANGIIIDPAGLELAVGDEGSSPEEDSASSDVGNEVKSCFIGGAVEDDATGRSMAGVLFLIGAISLCVRRSSRGLQKTHRAKSKRR